jgi:hypothetical protein
MINIKKNINNIKYFKLNIFLIIFLIFYSITKLVYYIKYIDNVTHKNSDYLIIHF